MDSYKMKYDVDIVFCIDATFSMGHVIEVVRNNALNLYKDIKQVMDAKRKYIENLRIKIVAFRDYAYDKEDAMMLTGFFNLPEESNKLYECLNSIKAFGGGDDPEDGLEALAYSMRSDWTKAQVGRKRRHVIVVWSDAETHELGFGKKAPNYPSGMAKDFNELTRWWGNRMMQGVMDENAKRLLMFTPDVPYWNMISTNWNNVIHFPSRAGSGLRSFQYEQILNSICNSI